MNRNRIIFVGLLVLLLVLLLIWLWPRASAPRSSAKLEPVSASQPMASTQGSPDLAQTPLPSTPEKTEPAEQEKRQKVVGQIEAMLNTPIEFYGKVVDQNSDPVPVARVGYSLLDKFNASGSNAYKFADEKGYFEISGVKGAVLGVNVSKEGYYQIHNISNQRFSYGVGVDTYTKVPPQKDNPAVFVLHKMGETEPLLELSSRQLEIPTTGQSVTIDLVTGQSAQSGLQVSLRMGKETQGRFDWRYELNIPGGGLVEREGQFEFEAPQSGYKNGIEVGMLASDPVWKAKAEKSYFVKLPDGKFARIQLRFYPRDYRSMIVIESYLNPTPGSRNLEYDPAKKASSP